MITRVFAVGEDRATLQKAHSLGQFLSKRQGSIQIDQFSKRRKSSFKAFNQNDLKNLFFLGSGAGSRFGDFTAQEFAHELAQEIWPPVDRMMVQHLYFIDTRESLTQDAFVQIQELTNELAKKSFGRIVVHVMTYKQALKDQAGSVLRALAYTYKPKESFSARAKRLGEPYICKRLEPRKQEEKHRPEDRKPAINRELLNVGLFSHASSSGELNAGLVTHEIPASLCRRGESLIGFLEEEIRLLEFKAADSYFSYFVRYEINTKHRKLACLKDLFKAQNLEQLQEKAKGWSKDERVLRHWRNTCAKTWGQSRTKDLLEDIINNPYKQSRAPSFSY